MLVAMFADRPDAGRRLAPLVEPLRSRDPVVLALPRGGVPVAEEVAAHLAAPLDVILVRKLGVPSQPELAMGAIGEGGVRVVNDEVVQTARIRPEQIDEVERRERQELERRARRYRAGRPPLDLAGRVVVIVDDGIATGSTAKAACAVARAAGAATVVLAVPVAPEEWTDRLRGAADEFVAVATPSPFFGVGQFYRRFTQTTDEEVTAALARAAHDGSGGNPGSAGRSAGEGAERLRGHRALPHTADTILEAWGPDRTACLEELVAAVVATCADVSGATPSGWRELVLPAGRDEAMVLALVDEVIFTIDAGEGMPVGADIAPTAEGGIAVRLRLADRASVEPTGSVPKAASRSGCAVEHRDDGVRCSVLVDV